MATSKGKRRRKVPTKFEESAVKPQLSAKETSRWYTLLCLEDHKEYLSTAKNMETVDGLEVAEEELRTGDVVVWQYRGAPYKAEIQAVHDKKPMPKANTKQKCTQHKYAEDSCSDNSDDDDSPPPPKKPLRQDTRPGPSVVLSDIESSPEAESATKRLSSLTEKVSIKSGKPFKDSSHQSPLDVELPSNSHRPLKRPFRQERENCSRSNLSVVLSDTESNPISPIRPVRSPSAELPSDIRQQLSSILQHLSQLESKVDSLVHQLPSTSTVSLKAEKNEPSTPLKVRQEQTVEKFITDAGVNLLSLRAVNPAKYALAILTALFTDEEMGRSCYAQSSRSSKPPLPADKIALLEECIDYKFGRGTVQANREIITKKCNQKCLDRGNPKKQLKKEKCDADREN